MRGRRHRQYALGHRRDRGVIIAWGANIGGWSVYCSGGTLKYGYNLHIAMARR
jgi:hypothetical protein